jgi:hypothetical protein
MNKYREHSRAAQKAAKRLKACESKAAFDTEEAAYQKGQRTYRCPHCNKWHRSGAFATLVNTLKKRGPK